MKKKMGLLILFVSLCTTGLFAKGLDFQVGAGYNGYFPTGTEAQNFPVGFAIYGGVGYKFFPTLSIGAEYEFARSYATDDMISGQSVTLSEHVPKAYIKFNALNILTITGLAGVDIAQTNSDGSLSSWENNASIGARISLLFAYAQYMVVLNDNKDSRISVGAVFSK